jgi:3-deoxy-D-manno-oct-2-ulosonic acid (Kdo) hydroxylase
MAMDQAEVLERLPITSWRGPFDRGLQQRAVMALEHGKVLVMPALPFSLTDEEAALLRPGISGGARKNVSLDPATGRLGNAALDPDAGPRLAAMMQRFADSAARLAAELLPDYAPALERARTSFRPIEIADRSYSPRHDDRRLHVDAFPSRPLRGRRIIRVFSNVAPDGAVRTWRVGENFETFAQRFLPRMGRPLPASAWLLAQLGITKGRRSRYDHIMLNLHDKGKLDAAYQANAAYAEVDFSPGTSWLCFTDQVLHAALAGHCALEQTFHLPVAAMAEPEFAPFHVLERLTGQSLA